MQTSWEPQGRCKVVVGMFISGVFVEIIEFWANTPKARHTFKHCTSARVLLKIASMCSCVFFKQVCSAPRVLPSWHLLLTFSLVRAIVVSTWVDLLLVGALIVDKDVASMYVDKRVGGWVGMLVDRLLHEVIGLRKHFPPS